MSRTVFSGNSSVRVERSREIIFPSIRRRRWTGVRGGREGSSDRCNWSDGLLRGLGVFFLAAEWLILRRASIATERSQCSPHQTQPSSGKPASDTREGRFKSSRRWMTNY